MRGLYSATYLSSLSLHFRNEQIRSEIDVGAKFNLIVGASTGSIIACALAAKVPLDCVIKLFKEHGPKVFPCKLESSLSIPNLIRLIRRKKHVRSGRIALTEALHGTKLGGTSLGKVWRERKIALAVPAIDMTSHKSWVFKTPHLDNNVIRDEDHSLADVCLAATAAPVYRSLALLKNPLGDGERVFCDGGLWANNPILISLIEALRITNPDQNIEIFCLGTCPRPEGETIEEEDIDRGIKEWGFGGGVVSLALDAQQYAFRNMARMLLRGLDREITITDFPHEPASSKIMDYLDLDETSSIALKSLTDQARNDANVTLAVCEDENDPVGQRIKSLFSCT